MRLNPTIFVMISFFGAIGILLIAVALPVEAQSNGEMKKFENSKMGLSFQIPSEWNLTSSEPQFCEFNACTLNFHRNLTGQSYPFSMAVEASKLNGSDSYDLSDKFCNCDSLEDFVKFRYNRDWKDLVFLNDNQTMIQNNRSAWQIEIKYNPDPRVYYILTTNNGYGYAFGYAAKDNSRFDTYLKDFKNMINSVVFNSTTSKKIPSFMKNKDTTNQSLSLLGNDNSNDQSSGMTANANIKISSTNSYVDSVGYYHIVGEVENNSPISISSVKVIATLYDNSNAVVGTDYGYADPSDIGPGDKAPFQILVPSASIPTQQIDHYRIVATYQ